MFIHTHRYSRGSSTRRTGRDEGGTETEGDREKTLNKGNKQTTRTTRERRIKKKKIRQIKKKTRDSAASARFFFTCLYYECRSRSLLSSLSVSGLLNWSHTLHILREADTAGTERENWRIQSLRFPILLLPPCAASHSRVNPTATTQLQLASVGLEA